MAKEDAALKDVSKTELAEAYSKLKAKGKAAQLQAKKEGQALLEDAVTLGSAFGLSYLMGQRHEEARLAAEKEGLDKEKIEEATAEGGQIAGIDLDLLVGGAGVAAGMMKLGGNMSNMVRKIGIGGLAAYAARIGRDKGIESTKEPEED